MLGAGGAAQGVISNLLDRRPTQLVIANRTHARAQDLVERFSDPVFDSCAMENLLDIGAFDLVISASSGGLTGDEEQQYLPSSLRGSGTCCYDMIYGKQTAFLNWAKTAESSDGLGMLVEQAARSFELWFGIKVQTAPVLENLRKEMNT